MEKIKSSVDSIDNPNTLDRILALLIKADTSTLISDSNPDYNFDKRDHCFKAKEKSKNEGRKQKKVYTENGAWHHYRSHEYLYIKNKQLMNNLIIMYIPKQLIHTLANQPTK